MRVLLLNLNSETNDLVNGALSGQGYDITIESAVQREQMADIAVESLSGGAVSKHRFWLIPAIFVVSAAAILAAGFIVFSTGRSRKETLQLRSEIARLNSGLGLHDQLLQRTEQARNSAAQSPTGVAAFPCGCA